MKNELIIARFTGQKKRTAAQRLLALLEEFGLLSLLDTRFAGLPDSAADVDAPPVGSDAP
jgi:hypothetical protein